MQPTCDPTRGKRVERAKAYQRKKHRSGVMSLFERISPLRKFFQGGVELDHRVSPGQLPLFTAEILRLLDLFEVPLAWGSGVELKIRCLGQHRADGLYFPDPPVVALDRRTLQSFAHELGHLFDYRARTGRKASGPVPTLSPEPLFAPFRARMLERMQGASSSPRAPGAGSGRMSWRYFASPSECFARAFEQIVAEHVTHPSFMVGTPSRYRNDALYFDSIPEGLEAYFRSLILTEVPALPSESLPGKSARWLCDRPLVP